MNSGSSIWLMRIYYLLWTGAGGFLFPFITLFYAHKGLNGMQIGWLSTIASLVALVSAPIFGRISDRVTNSQRVLQICLMGSSILVLLLSQQALFYGMALIIAAESLIGSPVFPLSDALALSISNDKAGFGSIRLWGSLGWAVTAFVGGWLVASAGLLSIFWGYAALYLLCILVLGRIVIPQQSSRSFEIPRVPFRVILLSLIKKRALLGLTIALTVFWLSNNGRHQFETLYMKNLGASEQLIGWSYTYPALLELPIMFWADRLLHKLGAGKLLSLSFLIEAVSLLVIVIFPSMAAILLMRAASGFYYSFYAIASIAYAVENAPEGQGATILSLYYVTVNSIIAFVTAPISGWLFDWKGAYPLYLLAASGTFISWLALNISKQKLALNPVPQI